MKNKKIIVLCLVLLLALIISGGFYTYAKYFTSTKRDIGSDIKKWNIKVNDEDITNKTSLSKNITASFVSNKNVAPNVIAPGSEGYFEITLDYSNVGVSFKYGIQISENPLLPDAKIYKLEVDGKEITGTGSIVEGTVNLKTDTNPNKVQNIKVYLKWNDDKTNNLDNKGDTDVAINNRVINFDVKFDFEQIPEA